MAPLPLTLLAGGTELSKLPGQLIDPPQACLVLGAERVLTQAQIPAEVGIAIDSVPRAPFGAGSHPHLVDGIVQGLKQNPEVQRLVVALEESDDAVAAAHAILSTTALRSLATLDAVIATVDAVHMSTRLMSGHAAATSLEMDRLAIADRIVVARGGDVTPTALGAIAHVLRSINQTGPIIAPAVAICCLDDLLDLEAWSGPPAVGSRPDQASPFLGPETPTMVVCRSDRPLDPQAFDRWLDGVLQDHGSRVLRLLGTVRLAGNERRTHLHGVRSYLIRSQQSGKHNHDRHNSNPDQPDGDPDLGDGSGSSRPTGAESLTALIGHGLPETAIQASFASCQR